MKSIRQVLRLTNMRPNLSVVRCLSLTSPTFKEPEAYKKAYNLFDADGDGSITPEELISILPALGETPGDLSLFFDGMSEATITNHRQICDFLTFMIQNVNRRDQATAEQELKAEFAHYDPKGTSIISADDLADWIDAQAPDLTDDEIENLIEGADVDGDGSVNYNAYLHLVLKKILKIDSQPLQKAYNHIDFDHDGEISQQELEIATGATKEIFDKVDFDHSGAVSFTEFLLSVFKTREEGAIRTAFQKYDLDNSGKITLKNLKDWCIINGLPNSQAAILVQEFDCDTDGAINYDEFINAVVHQKM